MMKDLQHARLENWSFGRSLSGRLVLTGQVFGHPKGPDGGHLTTSRVIVLDLNKMICITMNTEYKLGKQIGLFE